jgi:DNA-binding transcriptional LysR family regulator
VELRTLAYFVAVADTGTVSAAAETVRVTQPSLSRQLRGLERELGVDLFERSQGRLRLSPAGRAVLPHARNLLAGAQSLRMVAELQARGRLERITIAAPATTLTDVVSPFLATLTPNDPIPAVVESDGLSTEEARRLGADLVITAGRPRRRPGSLPLPPLPVWAYVPVSHAWADRRTVTVAELIDEDLLLLPVSHSARRAFDAAVLTSGASLSAAVETSNGTVAQALAAAGRGIAVVTDDARFDLVPLAVLTNDHQPVSIHLCCAWDIDHPAASTIAGLAARIQRYVAQTYGAKP